MTAINPIARLVPDMAHLDRTVRLQKLAVLIATRKATPSQELAWKLDTQGYLADKLTAKNIEAELNLHPSLKAKTVILAGIFIALTCGFWEANGPQREAGYRPTIQLDAPIGSTDSDRLSLMALQAAEGM